MNSRYENKIKNHFKSVKFEYTNINKILKNITYSFFLFIPLLSFKLSSSL